MWGLLAEATEVAQKVQDTADKAVSNSEAAIWMAGITMVGAAIAGVVAMFKDKHKLQHDSEKVQIKADLTYLTLKVKECEERHEVREEKLAECEEKHKENDRINAQYDARLQALESASYVRREDGKKP